MSATKPPTEPKTPPELGARIRVLVQRIGTQAIAANVAGITPQQLHNIMTGKSGPTFVAVAKLAQAAGVHLDWVMTGASPMLHEPTKATELRAGLDRELLGRVVDAIAVAYRDSGVLLPDIELGRLAAEEYDIIAAATDDPFERAVMVKLVAERHRRALANESSASRKRGA